ncbi:hypothetical protein F5Y14DRAFT_415532 [Nemania sp. NC0429]|nr:hypothetical protein F5Y14DRAFT_415532 [Nemania sp. NC0429]
MMATLRGPRRFIVVTFLVTSLLLILALRHREYIVGPSAPTRPGTSFAPDDGEIKESESRPLGVDTPVQEQESDTPVLEIIPEPEPTPEPAPEPVPTPEPKPESEQEHEHEQEHGQDHEPEQAQEQEPKPKVGEDEHDNEKEQGQDAHPEEEAQQGPDSPDSPKPDLELVVASIKSENTSWIPALLPDWRANIYVADDSRAPLTVPVNKGREAMVYLTYLIDRYDSLPENVVFVHASRFAWHNDDPDYDALPTLRSLRLAHLRVAGYVNLRCVWVIGCPGEIRPAIDAAADDQEKEKGKGKGKLTAKHVYKQAFEELFPGAPLPELVAVSCCSQFAVTRETVRARPREDYVRFREWLIATPLDDDLNGRVFEFSWHIIFGKEPVHCPSAAECYCNVFGLCDIPCNDQSSACDGRYTLPPYSTLPKGWPLVGWDDEARNFSGPLK